MDLPILFSDDHLLVINKPAGLVVDKSNTQRADTLEDILKTEFAISVERGGIVHRLDKDTSGVILIAKTPEVLLALQEQFKNRIVEKEYMTLVHGLVTQDGIVEGGIMRNPFDREKFMVSAEGKEAQTEYKVEKQLELPEETMGELFEGFNKVQLRKLANMNYSQFSLLRCLPKTGRTHQIRVHLKYIGHPLVSDEKYAGRKTTRLDHRWCPRQFLHATRLKFKHPLTNEFVVIEAPLPDDLKGALSKLVPIIHG